MNTEQVIFIQKIFPVYRKPIFDELEKIIDLKVLVGEKNSSIKTVEAPYLEYIPSIRYGKKDTNLLLFPIAKIIKYRPKIVICEFALGILNLPFIVLICKLLRIKIAFWSHGYNRKKGFNPEKKWIDKYRLFLMKWVDANIVYSQSDNALLQKYFVEKNVFTACNTLDTNNLTQIKKALALEGKKKIKGRLRISHEFNIVFIGRMLPSKKPELLIEVYSELKTKYGLQVGVHFIGNGEMLKSIKDYVGLNSVAHDFYFHGPLYDDLLTGQLLFISDLMIQPGDLGLSINHAYCFDCPVVSFKSKNNYPAHGPEVGYLSNNQTGFLIEEQTAQTMAVVVSRYLNNIEQQAKFRKNIRHAVKNDFPIEKMIAGLIECMNYLLHDTSHEIHANNE